MKGKIIDGQRKKTIGKIVGIGISALTCALMLIQVQTSIADARNVERLRGLTDNAITCSLPQFLSDRRATSHDEKNEPGCAHQMGAGSLCDLTDKRRVFHPHTC